jgi:YD repeat-containing protein
MKLAPRRRSTVLCSPLATTTLVVPSAAIAETLELPVPPTLKGPNGKLRTASVRIENSSVGRVRWAVAMVVLLVTALGAIPKAYGQVLTDNPPPPVRVVDELGMDLGSGMINSSGGKLSIGDPNNIQFEFSILPLDYTGVTGTVIFGNVRDIGGFSPGYYAIRLGGETIYLAKGSTNAVTGERVDWTTDSIILYRHDGSVWSFRQSLADNRVSTEKAKLETVTLPDGEVRTYTYVNYDLSSIWSTTGYQMHLEWGSTSEPRTPTRVQMFNMATDYCTPNAATCNLSRSDWPSLTTVQSGTVTTDRSATATDQAGRVTTFTSEHFQTPGQVKFTRLTTPGGVATTIGVDNVGWVVGCSEPIPVSVQVSGMGTWTYQWNYQQVTCKKSATISRSPLGALTSGSSIAGGNTSSLNTPIAAMSSTFNTIGNPLAAEPIRNQVIEQSATGQPLLQFLRDGRGNILTTTAYSHNSSDTLVRTANYDTTCTNYKTCNQPNYVIDARGNRTDFTYDPNHGGVLTKTLPAGSNGIRPQTRYTYQQLSARYKDASGQLISGPPIWKLVGTSTCQTQASCAGTADEIVTTIGYDGNLLPISETVRSGDGSISATTTKTYDVFGNLVLVDGPLPGTADTTRYVYNSNRERIAAMSPDPDGAGPLPVPVTRTTYNGDGQPVLEEQGTAADQSDQALAAMIVLREIQTVYDAADRKSAEYRRGGGSTLAVTQFSYDGDGRLECTAVRMNPAIFGSLPASACQLGVEGSFGPDRITRLVRDSGGQILIVQKAYGTPLQLDDRTNTYVDTKLATIADANGNKASFSYDGYYRQIQWNFPSKTTPGTTSTTDYEQYAYDAAGNRTCLRKRDGSKLSYTYDSLNRLLSKVAAATSGGACP